MFHKYCGSWFWTNFVQQNLHPSKYLIPHRMFSTTTKFKYIFNYSWLTCQHTYFNHLKKKAHNPHQNTQCIWVSVSAHHTVGQKEQDDPLPTDLHIFFLPQRKNPLTKPLYQPLTCSQARHAFDDLWHIQKKPHTSWKKGFVWVTRYFEH